MVVATGQITIIDVDDGRTQYTHFAYADSADGRTGFSKEDTGKKFIGVYQDFNAAGSDNPAAYSWTKWQGSDGAAGLPGKPGIDGRTPYIHFAWADSEDGRQGFETTNIESIDGNTTRTHKKYMGVYTDYENQDSSDPSRYKWTRVKGEDGANGVPGKPGADGRTPYIHFAYADSADGRTGFTVTGAPDKKYMGTYTDFVQPDSTDPSRYTWTKVKGDDGAAGKPSYVHFAYANSADGQIDFSITDSNNKRYMGTYTDNIQTDSEAPNKYKWVDLLGNIKIGGRNLWVNSQSTGYAAIEKLPENHITGQTECYRLEQAEGKNIFRFNIIPEFTNRFYTTLTLSAWVKYENVQPGRNIWQQFNCFKSYPLVRRNSKINKGSAIEYPNMAAFKGTSDWKRIEFTYNYGSNADYDELKMSLGFYLESVESGTAWVTGVKVELGTVATDYSLSPEDYEKTLSEKADQALTQEQINKLSERNELLKAEMEAKASAETVEAWITTIKNLTATEEAGRKEAEAAVIRASERITELQQKVGEMKLVTEFVDTYMSQSDEGLIVGQKSGSSKVLVSSDRISFISGGKEVASISQGVLQIDNGVFVKSLRIGRFVTIQDPTNADRNLTMYVGGV
jgi:pblB|nr:MAG TPA: tail protein [Bacteriophage sp.]